MRRPRQLKDKESKDDDLQDAMKKAKGLALYIGFCYSIVTLKLRIHFLEPLWALLQPKYREP
jgi:hypothetical protein